MSSVSTSPSPVAPTAQYDRSWQRDTLCIHADGSVEDVADLAPPIHLSTNFRMNRTNVDYVYSRDDQPTRRRVETVLGALENGHAVVYGSGLAAITALLQHVKPKRMMAAAGYHGSRDVFEMYRNNVNSQHAQPKMEIIDISDRIQDVQLVYIETPNNPDAQLLDIEYYANLAHKAGAVLAVDSTFATPMAINPLSLGADFVIHSTTKYLGGHSDVLGGCLVVSCPNRCRQLHLERHILGSPLGTLECALLLRSLRTLPLRMQKHSSNALIVAKWLAQQPQVIRVSHPGLEGDPSYALARRQLRLLPACFSFEMKSPEQAQHLAAHCHVFGDATSLGGIESLLDWRHRWDTHVTKQLVRISVGLEDAQDLIKDLTVAFQKVAVKYPLSVSSKL